MKTNARSYKVKQASKLMSLRPALEAAGFVSLDDQAVALGLVRSTAWYITRGNHKHSGVHAKVMIRMLRCKKLPDGVRKVLLEYVDERLKGDYGHRNDALKKFRQKMVSP